MNLIYIWGNYFYKFCPFLYIPMYKVYKYVFEYHERKFFSQNIKPGMIILDIGANIGIYSEFISSLIGEKGRVYSFEPEKKNFEILSKRLSKNKNIELINAAVSDKSGQINLYVSEKMNVDHRSYDNSEGRQAIKVPCVSIDDYFNNKPHIDFIKIDIQGFEYFALAGMKRILKDNYNIKLFMEFWPFALKRIGDNQETKIINFLENLKFSIYILEGSKLVPFDYNKLNYKLSGYINIYASRLEKLIS